MAATEFLHHRMGEQVAHDLGCGAQVVDGFEQRHDADAAGLARRLVGEEAAELGQKIKPQHVARMLRHRQDEGADRLRVRPVDRLADQVEKVEKLARLVRYAAEARQEAQGLVELGLDPVLPCRGAGLGPLALVQRVELAPEFLQHAVDDGGVLPDVEAHGAEAEGFHLPAQRPHQGGGERDGLHLRQRLLRRQQFADEFVGVAEAGSLGRGGEGGEQPLPAAP